MKPDQLHNRQREVSEQQADPNTKQLLKNYMDQVSGDVFSCQEQVLKNICTYFQQTATQQGIPVVQLFVKINKTEDSLRVYLYQNGKLLQEIPAKELVSIFAGQQFLEIKSIQEKIIPQINAYLMSFAKEHQIVLSKLSILLAYKESKVNIAAYNDAQFIKDIDLTAPLKYFKE